MRLRVLGGVAACALVFLAYTPVARADTITYSGAAAALSQSDVIPDRAEWKIDGFTGWFHATASNGQLVGNWDFGSVNPFLRDMADSGADIRRGVEQIGLTEARRFLSSPRAATNSAVLEFAFENAGDRDGDSMSDFRVTLASVRFVTSAADGNGQPVPTPEPASLVLLGSGLAGAAAYRFRRQKGR